MILTIDVGNTNITLGIYRGDRLTATGRIVTDPNLAGDEYERLLKDLFAGWNIPCEYIEAVIVSSVVPPLDPVLHTLCGRCFAQEPLFVGPETDMGISVCYEKPDEVGADRIVNAAAAYNKYRRSVVVVDLGTATTFDYVSPAGAYFGGAIAPGIVISAEALFQKAAKLPRVDVVCPEKVVGRNTVESMQSGIVYGYISLVDGIVTRIKQEVGTDPYVVATGGLAPIIAEHALGIDEVEEFLTLWGLKVVFDHSRNDPDSI